MRLRLVALPPSYCILRLLSHAQVVADAVLVEVVLKVALEDVDHRIQEREHERCGRSGVGGGQVERRRDPLRTAGIRRPRRGSPAFALLRDTATKYMSRCRMYMKLLPSISLTGGADPASFAAITCVEVAQWTRMGDAAKTRAPRGALESEPHGLEAVTPVRAARAPPRPRGRQCGRAATWTHHTAPSQVLAGVLRRTCIRNVFAALSETSSLRCGEQRRVGVFAPTYTKRPRRQRAAREYQSSRRRRTDTADR